MPDPKLFYLWTRRTLQKFYVFDGKEDLEKKKEIPECSSIYSYALNTYARDLGWGFYDGASELTSISFFMTEGYFAGILALYEITDDEVCFFR